MHDPLALSSRYYWRARSRRPGLNSSLRFRLPPFLTPRGTPEDQRNCRPDAVRLCKDHMGDDDATLRCFQANRAKLSAACAGVLEKYGR